MNIHINTRLFSQVFVVWLPVSSRNKLTDGWLYVKNRSVTLAHNGIKYWNSFTSLFLTFDVKAFIYYVLSNNKNYIDTYYFLL